MKTTSSKHVVYINCSECPNKNKNNLCTQHVLSMFWPYSELAIFMFWTRNSMNNLSSYYGVVDAKIRASDKYLPVSYFKKAIAELWQVDRKQTLFHMINVSHLIILFTMWMVKTWYVCDCNLNGLLTPNILHTSHIIFQWKFGNKFK